MINQFSIFPLFFIKLLNIIKYITNNIVSKSLHFLEADPESELVVVAIGATETSSVPAIALLPRLKLAAVRVAGAPAETGAGAPWIAHVLQAGPPFRAVRVARAGGVAVQPAQGLVTGVALSPGPCQHHRHQHSAQPRHPSHQPHIPAQWPGWAGTAAGGRPSQLLPGATTTTRVTPPATLATIQLMNCFQAGKRLC